MKIDMVLHLRVEVLQDHVVDVCPQVADGCVQKLKLVLDADLFKGRARRGVELRPLAPVGQVDGIHILHQFNGFFLPYMFIEGAAEIVGDIVFSVTEGTGPAEAGHDRAALAADAGFDLVSVYGAVSVLELFAPFKYPDLQVRSVFHQLVSRKNASRSGADNDHIIFHG